MTGADQPPVTEARHWGLEPQPRNAKPLIFETVNGERRLVAIIANDCGDNERAAENAALVLAAPDYHAAAEQLTEVLASCLPREIEIVLHLLAPRGKEALDALLAAHAKAHTPIRISEGAAP